MKPEVFNLHVLRRGINPEYILQNTYWASIEDSLAVERPPGGIDGDGEGSNVGQMVHHGGVVVAGKDFIATDIGLHEEVSLYGNLFYF